MDRLKHCGRSRWERSPLPRLALAREQASMSSCHGYWWVRLHLQTDGSDDKLVLDPGGARKRSRHRQGDRP